jgi:hypothetical protein
MSASARRELDRRVERSWVVILRAAVQEHADVGYGRVTIESIAARAGVGNRRSTVTGPTSWP